MNYNKNTPIKEFKIHGKTDITLKNIKTGLIEKVHSENTFQPLALQHFLQQNGILTQRTPFYDYDTDPLKKIMYSDYTVWRSLIGGLFLFQNAIPVGNEFMPAGNKMIGCGCREYTNETNVTEMGSFNSTDSEASLNDGMIKQVWDFTTAQANGTIGCASLTSMLGSRMGYGNPNGIRFINTPTGGTKSSDLVPLLRNENEEFIFGNIAYVLDMTDNHTFRVRKYKKGLTQLSLFNSKLIETLTFDLNVIGKGSMNFGAYTDRLLIQAMFYVGNGIFRFSSTYDAAVPNNEQWYYYEYNIANDTLILKSFVNQTGETIQESGMTYAFLRGNKLLVRSSTTSGRNFLIDLTDGTVIKTFDYNNNISIDSVGNIAGDENLISFIISGNTNTRIYDIINDTAYYTNEYGSYLYKRQWDENFYGYYGYNDNHYYHNAKFYKEPRYLATINNLQTPIEKTAAHTMKVTYTLEEV